jgi:hypothetical protein
MATLVATSQLTIMDLNDAIITGTAPSNPTTGTLWIDNSVSPNVLKEWNGSSWVTQSLSLQYLDNGSYTTITNNNQTLSDMASDSVITQIERVDVKNTITNIIGYVPADNMASMPTGSTLDSSGAGEYWSVRKAATNAGVSTSDTSYTTFATNYTALATYLNGLTPKPWDISSTSSITVTASTWRANWYNYYDALYKLQQATSSSLHIIPGGRNYLYNTSNFVNITNWSLNVGSAVTTSALSITNDSTYGNVLNVNVTANSATGNNWMVIQNTGLSLPNGKFTVGNTYTLSFLIMNAMAMVVNFENSDGTSQVATTGYSIPASPSTWQKVVWTFTATATGATPELYLAMNDHSATGNIYLTQVQLEDGNRATGYHPAPEDISTQLLTLTNQVTNVQTSIGQDNITNTVTSSTKFQAILANYATSSQLASYDPAGSASQAQSAAQGYTDQKIAGIDFSPYVTQSQFTQKNSDITASFQNAGGINMLQNSIGFSGSDFWTVTGTWSTTNTPDLNPYGLKSGFVLTGGTLSQVVTVTPGVTYTISCRVKKGTAGTAYITVADTTQTATSQTETINFASGTAYGYSTLQSVNIAPTSSSVTVTINGDATSGGTIFSGIMLNIGNTPFSWSNSPTESYNGAVNMDINGIRVQQADATGKVTGYTVMTPTKFAGYSDQNGDGVIDQSTGSNDEVFRMDKDTFVMKSATIKPIKMVPVTSGGYNGIAFVPS